MVRPRGSGAEQRKASLKWRGHKRKQLRGFMLSIVISEGLGKIKLHQKTLWELQRAVSRQK